MFKIHKKTLIDNNWKELFNSLGNDTQHVAQFIKHARKTYKVRANELDNVLADIGSKVNEYVTMDSSGSFSHH